jgi:catechol 2,3-dioxygenase-like lactoylglutathione lyase family enzyme
MNPKPPAPVARLTMITLGVSNMRASVAFYEALGFKRKFRAAGDDHPWEVVVAPNIEVGDDRRVHLPE